MADFPDVSGSEWAPGSYLEDDRDPTLLKTLRADELSSLFHERLNSRYPYQSRHNGLVASHLARDESFLSGGTETLSTDDVYRPGPVGTALFSGGPAHNDKWLETKALFLNHSLVTSFPTKSEASSAKRMARTAGEGIPLLGGDRSADLGVYSGGVFKKVINREKGIRHRRAR